MRYVISHSDHVSGVPFECADRTVVDEHFSLSIWVTKRWSCTEDKTRRINLYFISERLAARHPTTDIGGRADVTALSMEMNESRMWKRERGRDREKRKSLKREKCRPRWKTEKKKPHRRNYVLSFGFSVPLRRKSHGFRRSSLSAAMAEYKSMRISTICHCHRHGHGSTHSSSMLMASIKSEATPTEFVCVCRDGIARV